MRRDALFVPFLAWLLSGTCLLNMTSVCISLVARVFLENSSPSTWPMWRFPPKFSHQPRDGMLHSSFATQPKGTKQQNAVLDALPAANLTLACPSHSCSNSSLNSTSRRLQHTDLLPYTGLFEEQFGQCPPHARRRCAG